MREKKFTRIAAFALCLCTLFGSATVLASAAEPSSSGSTIDVSSSELKELLNAITYLEYQDKYLDVKRATGKIEVPIASFVATSDDFKMVVRDGYEALYTPQDGSVTWVVDIPQDVMPAGKKEAKFAICIEYYPDANRSTSIERILKIF